MIAIMFCSSCQTPWTLHTVIGAVAVHTCGGSQPAPGWTQGGCEADAILTPAEQATMVAEVLALVERDGRRTVEATTQRRNGRAVLHIAVPAGSRVGLAEARAVEVRL